MAEGANILEEIATYKREFVAARKREMGRRSSLDATTTVTTTARRTVKN